jgi:radical SAM-linked protein
MTSTVVQRIRIQYAKRGRLRFSSHRDFQRSLERALRRIGAPVAMSSGFSPRPRISYANSAPTGASSEAEYVEIAMTRPVEPEVVRDALNAALPDGLDVVDAVIASTPDFAVRLEASRWRIEFPGLGQETLSSAVEQLLGAPEAMVERTMKSGRRRFDARSALSHAQVSGEGCAILTVVVRHGTPSVRPDDVVMALHVTADLVPPEPPRFTRLAQGPLDEQSGAISDPLETDRAAHRPT